MVVEVWAAVAGASVGVASAGLTGMSRQSQQGRDSLIRLTTAVDNLASRLDVLHAVAGLLGRAAIGKVVERLLQ